MPAKSTFSKAQLEVLYDAARKARKKYKNQTDFALALGITQPSASSLLLRKWKPGLTVARHIAEANGQRLEDLVGELELPAEPPKRGRLHVVKGAPAEERPNLEVCIQFHTKTKSWAAWTLASARAGIFGPTDFDPAEWTGRLDALETTLSRFQKEHRP